MKQLFDYSSINIDIDNSFFAGISYFPTAEELVGDGDYTYTEILPIEEFRPDKIAYRVFGNQNLHWILDVLNDFPNGITEYTRGKTIKYVSLAQLQNLGII